MMLRTRLYLLAATILLASSSSPNSSLSAAELTGRELVLPIVARTPGAYGSEWRTDIFVTNTSRRLNPVPVRITFHPTGEAEKTHQVLLQPRGTITLRDVVLGTFGREQGSGLVRISSEIPGARLTARARIYNVGGWQGEFGQTSQALPVSLLGTEVFLSGLDVTPATRTNLGIANPGMTPAKVFLSLFTTEGDFAGGYSTTVAPRSVMQINGVFGTFQTMPAEDATIVLTSSRPIYGYASVVRNDSGDADFVTGIGGPPEDPGVVTPACSDPAPLGFAPAGWEAEGWIVGLEQGTDTARVAAELASTFGFTLLNVYEHIFSFHADMTQEQIAELRCDDRVISVEQNQIIPLP